MGRVISMRAKHRAAGKISAKAMAKLNKLMLDFANHLLEYRHDLENEDFKAHIKALDNKWKDYLRTMKNAPEKSTFLMFRDRVSDAIDKISKIPSDKVMIGVEELPALKLAYQKACNEGVQEFVFKDEAIVTAYAKYLIEFLEDKT